MQYARVRRLVATWALAGAIACGGAGTEPPVATPSLSIDQARAPLGAPIEMTYRFEVLPGATIDGDYRVMVHFVDVDDELMWADDHDPPTPTSAWRPGQPVEYTRTLFLPIYPYLGRAVVRVGLYDQGSGRRLALSGDDAGQRAYEVASVELAPESESVFVVHGKGWHVPEVSPGNALEEWRWTEQEATVSFRNPKRDVTVFLEVDGRPDLFGGAQLVSLRIGGQVVDSLTLTTVDRVLHKAGIPAASLGDHDVVEMTIASDHAFVPSESGGADPRQLAVRVFHLYVQ